MPGIKKTVKIQIYPTEEQAKQLHEIMCIYRDACNYASEGIFKSMEKPDFELNTVELTAQMYPDICRKFGIKVQMAQSVIRTVVSRYKTVRKQFQDNPMKFKDNSGKWYTIYRDLSWLQKSIRFKKPQAEYVYRRDYKFIRNNSLVSISTMTGRIRVNYSIPKNYRQYKYFGTAKLLYTDRKWYLAAIVT